MARKTYQSSLGRDADIGIDYALILTAAGAALLALIYLIVI